MKPRVETPPVALVSLYRRALRRADAVGDVVDDLLIGGHPALVQHSLDAGHELLRPGVHHADVGDEETTAHPVQVVGDEVPGGEIVEARYHFAVGDRIATEFRRQTELERLPGGSSAGAPTVGETSEQSDVQPAEVARTEGILRRRSTHELVFGVHRRRVVGVDGVRLVLRVARPAEDGVDARHQTESPEFRAPDEDKTRPVLRKTPAPNDRHVMKVARVVEVGDYRVVDELERRHPASVVSRRV